MKPPFRERNRAKLVKAINDCKPVFYRHVSPDSKDFIVRVDPSV